MEQLRKLWGGKISDQGIKDRIRMIMVRKMLGDIQQVQAHTYRQEQREKELKLMKNPLQAKKMLESE